jgi:hypothetical protein
MAASVIRHTVCFALRDADDPGVERAFVEEARSILSAIPGVRDFAVARQVGSQSPLALQFSMVFTDRAAYDAYTAHPAHVEFVRGRWEPAVASFQELDFEPYD